MSKLNKEKSDKITEFLKCRKDDEKSSSRIIIKDPLYKQIFVEPEHKQLLDCKEFQRLRFIKQTTFVDLVYPNANHTRFSHSLGVYHLMKKVINNRLMDIDDKNKDLLLKAALLHDIGHGPFSHFWEQLFPHFDHEKSSRAILKTMGLDGVADLLDGKHPLYYLISSTIDVDKLDYMARDSYFSGVSYGVAEVDFIIDHMYVKDGKLVIKPSALSSVEDLITQRVNLFKTVYFHKFAIECDFLFKRLFQRVREIIKEGGVIRVNSHLRAFFDKTDTVDDLLALNDVIIIAQIFEWANHSDPILSDLASMFVERKKFKIINLKYQKVDIEKIKKKVAEKYDLKYYFCEVCFPIKIIQVPIYVEIDNDLRALSELSELINFYKTQKWNVQYVMFPRDVDID